MSSGSDEGAEAEEAARQRSRSHARSGATSSAWTGAAQSAMRDWAAYARGAVASVLLPPSHASEREQRHNPFSTGDARQPPQPQSAAAAARPAPFSDEQTDWIRAALGDAVGASLAAFAQHVQSDVSKLRTGICTVRFEIAYAAVCLQRVEETSSSAADVARRAS